MNLLRNLLPLPCIFALLSPNEAQADFSTAGLVAHYQFSENANDASGNGLHGTLGNVAFGFDRFGNANKAVSLFGNGSSVITINTTSLNLSPNFSVSAWINFTAGSGSENPRIFSTAGYEIGVDTTGANRITYFNNTTASLAAPTAYSLSPIPAGVWHHIVGVRIGNELQLYLNGNFASSVSAAESPSYSRGWPPTVGANSGFHPFDTFGGFIDDLRVYDRALSATEIQQLFQVESVPEPATTALFLASAVLLLNRRLKVDSAPSNKIL